MRRGCGSRGRTGTSASSAGGGRSPPGGGAAGRSGRGAAPRPGPASGADDLRLGGVGEVEPYLARYCELTGRDIAVEDLFWWEVLGNVKWAVGALTQSRRHLSGQERSVELAVLGRLAAEMEYELLDLLEKAA